MGARMRTGAGVSIVVGGVGRVATALVTTVVLSGCIFQQDPKVVEGAPYAAPSAKSEDEHRDVGSPKMEAAPSANAVDVTLTQANECRDRTPMVRDVETHRTANVTEQWINGGSAGLLGGIGIYALVAPCTTTPDATKDNPSPASRDCTAKEENGQKIAGGVLLGVGALFGAAFVYNVIKARDTKETVPVQTTAQWKACGTRPVADSSLHLDFGDGQQVVATTNAQGQAHFDLSSVRWSDEVLKARHAKVASGGQQLGNVDLTHMPQYTEWQRRQQQDNEQRRKEVAHDAALKALQEIESGSRTAGPPWTEPRMNTFAGLILAFKGIDASALTDPERKRLDAAAAALDTNLPSFKKELAASEARAAQKAIPTGRQVILSQLKSPSTANFVSDSMLLQCSSGTFITRHTVDAQNGFGAMIRQETCATFNVRAGVKRCWNSMESGIECSMSCGNHVPFGKLPTCDDLDNKGQVWRPF